MIGQFTKQTAPGSVCNTLGLQGAAYVVDRCAGLRGLSSMPSKESRTAGCGKLL